MFTETRGLFFRYHSWLVYDLVMMFSVSMHQLQHLIAYIFWSVGLRSLTFWSNRAKYQKNVEAYHNRSGAKPNVFPNYIRSESYMITFELEEEKWAFFIWDKFILLSSSFCELGLFVIFFSDFRCLERGTSWNFLVTMLLKTIAWFTSQA